jgi:hypothetical protein
MKLYDIILKRYDIILKCYDIILKRYDIILETLPYHTETLQYQIKSLGNHTPCCAPSPPFYSLCPLGGWRLGLKQKRVFSFLRKVKIKRKWANFREILFRENIRFWGKFLHKIFVSAKVFAKTNIFAKVSFIAKYYHENFTFTRQF